ncbi:hypothetical protein KEJ43_07315 [Candidatus Bathyarchaeota archaeon]|nr:hypothetical protein [Candidatus Bathyarchaeota archaeon]
MGAEMDKKERSLFTVPNILSMLYFVSGVMLIASMSLAGGLPIHLGLVGALNITVSYSLTKKKKWSFYIAVFSSLLSITFGFTTLTALMALFSPNMEEILTLIGIVAYMVLSAILLAYVINGRKTFS